MRIMKSMRDEDTFAYDGEVGLWWLRRSMDGAHRRAYRNIADFIQASYRRSPRLVVDYACGPGTILSLLSLRFRHSRFVGLDGSSFMLEAARRRFSSLPRECRSRISVIETPLPKVDVMPAGADLVVFCFPNMMPFPKDDCSGCGGLSRDDIIIARELTGSDEHYSALEYGRCISHSLRRLLVDGGLCVRIEYASKKRHELSPSELEYVSFEEGSLDQPVAGRIPEVWFRVRASAYFRSRVLSDVYEQTGDDRDRKGGYLITVLEAV
ncbi:MAG: class I SAM-dependent methyltransferase [Acidobacteria bacterium]|nr:class I SAM-dependent methyltransferase [Acidobacteriota bacterium]